jgi:hypothetical protein
MSRGLGRRQQALLTTIQVSRKPMTFEDIRAAIRAALDLPADARFQPAFERSLRRALHSLVRDALLISIGGGGPGDPLRYLPHSMLVGMSGDKAAMDEYMRVVVEALDKPGAVVRGIF